MTINLPSHTAPALDSDASIAATTAAVTPGSPQQRERSSSPSHLPGPLSGMPGHSARASSRSESRNGFSHTQKVAEESNKSLLVPEPTYGSQHDWSGDDIRQWQGVEEKIDKLGEKMMNGAGNWASALTEAKELTEGKSDRVQGQAITHLMFKVISYVRNAEKEELMVMLDSAYKHMDEKHFPMFQSRLGERLDSMLDIEFLKKLQIWSKENNADIDWMRFLLNRSR